MQVELVKYDTEATCSEKLSWSSIITPMFRGVLVGVNEDGPGWMLIICGIVGLAGNTKISVLKRLR